MSIPERLTNYFSFDLARDVSSIEKTMRFTYQLYQGLASTSTTNLTMERAHFAIFNYVQGGDELYQGYTAKSLQFLVQSRLIFLKFGVNATEQVAFVYHITRKDLMDAALIEKDFEGMPDYNKLKLLPRLPNLIPHPNVLLDFVKFYNRFHGRYQCFYNSRENTDEFCILSFLAPFANIPGFIGDYRLLYDTYEDSGKELMKGYILEGNEPLTADDLKSNKELVFKHFQKVFEVERVGPIVIRESRNDFIVVITLLSINKTFMNETHTNNFLKSRMSALRADTKDRDLHEDNINAFINSSYLSKLKGVVPKYPKVMECITKRILSNSDILCNHVSLLLSGSGMSAFVLMADFVYSEIVTQCHIEEPVASEAVAYDKVVADLKRTYGLHWKYAKLLNSDLRSTNLSSFRNLFCASVLFISSFLPTNSTENLQYIMPPGVRINEIHEKLKHVLKEECYDKAKRFEQKKDINNIFKVKIGASGLLNHNQLIDCYRRRIRFEELKKN